MTALGLLVMTGVKLALLAIVGHSPPFLLYFGAVVVAAWFGGWVMGLLTTMVAGFLGVALFAPPSVQLATLGSDMLTRLVAFLGEGLLISLLADHAQLLPAVPDWRWGRRGDHTPWYPSMRLWRQRQAGDWAEVMGKVAAALAARVGV